MRYISLDIAYRFILLQALENPGNGLKLPEIQTEYCWGHDEVKTQQKQLVLTIMNGLAAPLVKCTGNEADG